jgi:TrmH family RNA methyltransferase
MSEVPVITSRSNALVQRARRVVAGDLPGFMALEGDRLVDDAIRARHALEVVLVAHDRGDRARELERNGQLVKLVDASIVEQVSSLQASPGILAIAPVPPGIDLAAVELDARTLILVVAGIADPGNLGALARAAEAFGATAIVTLAGSASPWSTKALRGSMGSLLRLPVASAASAESCSALLAQRSVRQVGAATRGGTDPSELDWKGPIAIWITGETGAAPVTSTKLELVTIPIAERVESLNVTVAASILLYCAGRSPRRNRG